MDNSLQTLSTPIATQKYQQEFVLPSPREETLTNPGSPVYPKEQLDEVHQAVES